jgi:hypothetical protein
MRRLFSINSSRGDYEFFAEEYSECHSVFLFSESALRMLSQGDSYREGRGNSSIGDEATERFLQIRSSDRVEIQEDLQSLGFDPGSLDGIFGASTRNAISEFTEYSTGVASEYLSLSTWSHLRLMNRVVPDDGVWQVEISRESTNNPREDRNIGTVRINIEGGEVSDYQVTNGYGTRLIVQDIDVTRQGRLNLVIDGFYLVGTPTRSQRIVASVPFPERQLFGTVDVREIGSFDQTFRAVLSLRRE